MVMQTLTQCCYTNQCSTLIVAPWTASSKWLALMWSNGLLLRLIGQRSIQMLRWGREVLQLLLWLVTATATFLIGGQDRFFQPKAEALAMEL